MAIFANETSEPRGAPPSTHRSHPHTPDPHAPDPHALDANGRALASSGRAGDSADRKADDLEYEVDRISEQIIGLQDLLNRIRQQCQNYRTGAHGERQVAESIVQVIVDLGSSNWHLLSDRRWPGRQEPTSTSY